MGGACVFFGEAREILFLQEILNTPLCQASDGSGFIGRLVGRLVVHWSHERLKKEGFSHDC